MLDLLAVISSADPTAMLAWLVLAFAAGMYPIGVMLGTSCSPCCGCKGGPGTCETTGNCAAGCVCVEGKCVLPPCGTCAEGELPETLTVTFDGLQDRAPGPDLCLLTFSAPYGNGAAGKVTAPGGEPSTDKGPISSVSLTAGGSGYAKFGRVAPTITASGGSGTGAVFSVSTTSSKDENGVPSWSVTGVTLTGTPSGYFYGDQVFFEAAAGDTEEQAATATIRTTRSAPTLTAEASGGNGAAFSVATAANGTTPQTWSVTGVTVTNGGTGYPASGAITFNKATGDTENQPAFATFYTGRIAPTVAVAVGGSGSGAVVSGTLSTRTDFDGRTYWYISGIAITNGGSGYSRFDDINATVTDGVSEGSGNAFVSSVDGNGAVTGVNVGKGGRFYKSDGTIQSVELFYNIGGSYYREGSPYSVYVENGGKYYREDASASPYVATVTVGVAQTAPSDGSGATLTATVDSSTSSPNFGEITGVTIGNGGANYLAWQWRNTACCGDYYNGLSVVVKRLNYGDNDPCRYEHRLCGVGNINNITGRVQVFYNGPTTPPYVSLQSEMGAGSSSICNTVFTATENVADCSDWSGLPFPATGGATASVTAGGEYDETYKNPGGDSCHVCCKGHELPPQEITVSVTGAGNGSVFDIWPTDDTRGSYDGDFVLSRVNSLAWFFDPPQSLLSPWNLPPLYVSIQPCASQGAESFGEDAYGCDFCHKKCRVVFNWADAGFEQRFCQGSDPAHCGQCNDTPRCSPVGASFTLCANRPAYQQIIANNDCTDYGMWVDDGTLTSISVPGPGTSGLPGPRCTMNASIS